VSDPAAKSPGFLDDLGKAVLLWRRAPLMPIISVLLFSALGIPSDGPWIVAGLTLEIATVGWIGVERIWYLRLARGNSLAAGEVWPLWKALFGRYARLGLAVSLTFVPVIILLVMSNVVLVRVAGGVWGLVFDLALTFVTPALAFTTRRVRTAARIGLRMVHDEWPSCAWYVLAPPLLVTLLSQTVLRAYAGTALGFGAGACGTLFTLACKGATAAFYLRKRPSGENGAAFEEQAQDGVPPTPARPDAPQAPFPD
jgi:hypothetical protein